MAETGNGTSPLAATDPTSVVVRDLTLDVEPFPNVIGLRVEASSTAHRCAAQTLGLDLDIGVNRVIFARGRAALRLGPDEWLVDTGVEEAAAVAAMLGQALDGMYAMAVDLSDGLSAFNLGGARSTDVLRKGCALDLHPAAFGADHATRTTLAQATIVLRRTDMTDGWRFLVDRSLAAYTWTWLRDAAREFTALRA